MGGSFKVVTKFIERVIKISFSENSFNNVAVGKKYFYRVILLVACDRESVRIYPRFQESGDHCEGDQSRDWW